MSNWTDHQGEESIDNYELEQSIKYIEKFDGSITLDDYILQRDMVARFRYYHIPVDLVRDNIKEDLLKYLYMLRANKGISNSM